MNFKQWWFTRFFNALRPSDAYMRHYINHHWFRQWLVAWPAPSHYLNQCWNIGDRNLRSKLQWNLKRNPYLFFQNNSFQTSSAKWLPFCLGLDELIHVRQVVWQLRLCQSSGVKSSCSNHCNSFVNIDYQCLTVASHKLYGGANQRQVGYLFNSLLLQKGFPCCVSFKHHGVPGSRQSMFQSQ